MLINHRNIFVSNNSVTTNFRGVTADDNYIYATLANNTFQKYDIKTGATVSGPSGILIVANNSAITLITAATACVFSTNSSQVDYIDVNTGARTQVTSGATTLSTQLANQQVDSANGVALACRSTTGGLLRATASGGLSNMTVSSLSGVNATSILANSASGVWFVGTTDGRILTLDQFGNLVNTITLSKTPNIATPTNIKVTGLSFYDPYLICCTNLGNIYLFNYWSGLEMDRALSDIEQGSNTFPSMCQSKHGFTTITSNIYNVSNLTSVDQIYFGNGRILRTCIPIESSISMIGSLLTSDKMIVWNADSGFFQLRIYNIDQFDVVSVDTEAQDPPGTQVSARIVRIMDNGIGKKSLFSDTNISAGTNSLPAIRNSNFIELAIKSSSKWDIREFTG